MNNKMSRKKYENPSGNLGGREKESKGGVEFDMKKARFEVMKFAMNGLSGSAKQDAETALAVSLGAKPPKSSYVNYKDLQATRKKENEERVAHKFNNVKPKLTKFGSKTVAGKKSVQKKRTLGHKLETTGIYKIKAPLRTSESSRTSMLSKSRGKRRS